MRIATHVVRTLIGLIFVVFGLNTFFLFMRGTLPPGMANDFVTALSQSHYFEFVGAVQLVGGALLLVNRFVPLGLTLLGPVIANILAFHIFLFHQGWPLAAVVALLWLFLVYRHRQYFSSLFVQRAA